MIINNPKDLVEKIQKKKEINFIPTMGNLHEGHLNLLKIAKNKEHFSGCTVHFVNSKLDSGKIILQKKVKVRKNDTPKSLSRRVLDQEHKLYPKAILKIFNL